MTSTGTIIGQIHAASTQPSAVTATTPTSIQQVAASPNQIQHLQATQPQTITISQPQPAPLPPTTISPPKEVDHTTPITTSDSQNTPMIMDTQKEEIIDGKILQNLSLRIILNKIAS